MKLRLCLRLCASRPATTWSPCSNHALNKVNALDLAAREGVGEERVIAALLNAVGLGIFEMSWNVMCPSCAGALSANKSLKTLDRTQYSLRLLRCGL